MKVILAQAMGLCFGVRRALEVARNVESPERTTIYGELVHNEIVSAELEARGFRSTAGASRGDLPDTPTVLITAHGISDQSRRRLEACGENLIDTTCPLVRRLHDMAQSLTAERYYVLVIGRPGHVEVQGIVEDLRRFEIVSSPSDVRSYPGDRLGIVCQTTTPPWLAEEIRREIGIRNRKAEIRFVDTICKPTRDRQAAVEQLLPNVDAVVVVGGRNSNNTRALLELCRQRGVPAYHVQSASDLEPRWFDGFGSVGLTAGTSTLSRTIQEVHQALCQLQVGVTA